MNICVDLKLYRYTSIYTVTKINYLKYHENAYLNIPFIENASFHVYLELLNNTWYHIIYKKLLLLFIFWETFMSFQFNHMVWKWLQLVFVWYTEFYIKREGLKLIDKTLRNFPLYSSYLFCQSLAYIIFPPFSLIDFIYLSKHIEFSHVIIIVIFIPLFSTIYTQLQGVL